jgi:hypothetical protein
VSLYYLERSAISTYVIRFRHVTKELLSSVTPFLLCKGCLDRTSRNDLKLLLDAQREDVVLVYLIVDDRAPPDERQGNLSCIFTTSVRLNSTLFLSWWRRSNQGDRGDTI